MQTAFPGTKDKKCGVSLKNCGDDVSRYRKQVTYLYKRELFEIHSCSLFLLFAGSSCLFGRGLEWTLPIFSLYTIHGCLCPCSSHRASFLMASLRLPFSLMQCPISHHTIRDHEACTHNPLLPRPHSELSGL